MFKKIISVLILSSFINVSSWANINPGYVPVTKTSVPFTQQQSDIQDSNGTVTITAPSAVVTKLVITANPTYSSYVVYNTNVAAPQQWSVGSGLVGGGDNWSIYNNTAGGGTEALDITTGTSTDIYSNGGSWSDYSLSSTINGFSAITTKSIYTKRIGKTVFVEFYINGTSNSTATSFTVPYAAASAPVATTIIPFLGVDNGTYVISSLYIAASSATINVYNGIVSGGGNWTNSGNKILYGSFFYQST